MESVATASIAPPLQLAHDTAAQIMSQLPAATNITEEDRRTLQDFYHELEQRHARLAQGAKDSIQDDQDDETVDEDILDSELKEAAEFPAFLKSLDPRDDAAKILIEGKNRVVGALGMIEKGENFLADAPMEKILDMYESIKSREEHLKAGGAPVSLVNAKIYLSETVRFADTVEAMIVLDMKAPTVQEGSAVKLAELN